MRVLYRLIDPRTNEIRYVGITKHPQLRYSQHLHPNLGGNPGRFVMVWLEELHAHTLQPQFEAMAMVEDYEAHRIEARYIAYLLGQGVRLLNTLDPRPPDNQMCACGCEQPVKPGQRWYEPACKARAYRERQRNERYEDSEHAIDVGLMLMELRREYEDLEQAYTRLREDHSQCPPPPSAVKPEEAWAWRYFRDAISTAYRELAKREHPDLQGSFAQTSTRMAEVGAAYMEISRFMRSHGA